VLIMYQPSYLSGQNCDSVARGILQSFYNCPAELARSSSDCDDGHCWDGI
jgi:hypothetical protein